MQDCLIDVRSYMFITFISRGFLMSIEVKSWKFVL